MRYFVLFEDDGDALIKKIAGYHQFHGVREAVRVTTIAAADSDDDVVREKRARWGDEVQPGSRKAGVFWHTQGSGKSISMCCYAGKLLQQPAMKNPTLTPYVSCEVVAGIVPPNRAVSIGGSLIHLVSICSVSMSIAVSYTHLTLPTTPYV